MKNNYGGEVPLGLGMALAQNQNAMNEYAMFPESKKQAVIKAAGQVSSKPEMQSLVSSIANGNFHKQADGNLPMPDSSVNSLEG